MFLYLSILLILVSFSAFYFLYYEPKQKIKKFAQQAQALGYKVKLMPFQFMGYYLLKYEKSENRNLRVYKQQFSKYDMIIGNIFTNLAILPLNPKILKDVFNQLNKLPKSPFVSQVFQLLNGGGVAFSQGETWKRKRRIISSVFHFDFLNDMIPTIQNQIQKQFLIIDKLITEGKTINLQKIFIKMLSSIVAKCFFGTDMSEYQIQGQPYCYCYMHFLDQIIVFATSLEHVLLRMKSFKYGLTEQGRKLKRKYTLLTQIAKQITQKELTKIKNKQQPNKNMITALYEAGMLQQNNQPSQNKYTIYELIGQFMTFFAAGTDTTSNSINLALHYLSENQKHIQKVRQELKNIQSIKDLTNAQKLKNMKYIDAIFNEVLRIGGPSVSLFPRQATQDLVIGQLKIQKGTSISLVPLINHYKQENFQNHTQFNPQRWLKDIKVQPYTYLPFGGGERNCIGQYLARIQAKLLISRIIEKYDFKAVYPIEMQARFVYATQHGQFEMKIRDDKK